MPKPHLIDAQKFTFLDKWYTTPLSMKNTVNISIPYTNNASLKLRYLAAQKFHEGHSRTLNYKNTKCKSSLGLSMHFEASCSAGSNVLLKAFRCLVFKYS